MSQPFVIIEVCHHVLFHWRNKKMPQSDVAL